MELKKEDLELVNNVREDNCQDSLKELINRVDKIYISEFPCRIIVAGNINYYSEIFFNKSAFTGDLDITDNLR